MRKVFATASAVLVVLALSIAITAGFAGGDFYQTRLESGNVALDWSNPPTNTVYYESGTYTSEVMDVGEDASWDSMTWVADLPAAPGAHKTYDFTSAFENINMFAYTRTSCDDPNPPENNLWPYNACGTLTDITTSANLDYDDDLYEENIMDVRESDSEGFFAIHAKFDEDRQDISSVDVNWIFKHQGGVNPKAWTYYWDHTTSAWVLCGGPYTGNTEQVQGCYGIPGSDVVSETGDAYFMLYGYNHNLNNQLRTYVDKVWVDIEYTARTDISFQARSCDDSLCAGEEFTGPDGTSSTYYETSGEVLNVPDNRYFQYKAYLSTQDTPMTPTLESVDVQYTLLPAEESEARNAMETGILNEIPGAAIYTDKQVYVRYSDDTQMLGRFDKVAVYGNQRWLFNYISAGDTYNNFPDMEPVVYTLEMEDKPPSEITSEVENLIAGTKQ